MVVTPEVYMLLRGLSLAPRALFRSVANRSCVSSSECGNYWFKKIDDGRAEVGVTDAWMDAEVEGDVDSVAWNPSSSKLSLEWSGLICGEGDEVRDEQQRG